jgi:hypothetical protein
MKIINLCLSLILIVEGALVASCEDQSSLTSEDTVLSSVLSAIVKPGHLELFECCFPPLTNSKDLGAKRDLIMRIDRMYGAHLRANHNFHSLITPLIDITSDLTGGYHMGFVWSDCRLSYLKLYAETIVPPIFTYDSALEELAKPNGPERYAFFMMRVTSFSHPTDLSRMVWANIFNIDEAQFRTLTSVIDALDSHGYLEAHIQNVFDSTFKRSIWDGGYWQRFIASFSLDSRSSACLPTLGAR